MSIAYVGSADLGDNGGSGTLTVSYTVGSGSNRLLVVGISGDTTTDNITGVTYNGVAMTQALKHTGSGSADRTNYQYYLLNPASGAHNVVISASSAYILAVAADYSGVKQSGQPDGTNAATGTGTVTCSITVGTINAWGVLVGSGFDSNNPPTAGTGSTRRTFSATNGVVGLFDSNAGLATGSRSMTLVYGGGSTASGVMVTYLEDTTPATGFGPLLAGARSQLVMS